MERLELNTEWTELDTAIEGFEPEADKKYQIQNIGNQLLQMYEGETAPAEDMGGFIIPVYKGVIWTKKEDKNLYVRSVADNTTIIISEM